MKIGFSITPQTDSKATFVKRLEQVLSIQDEVIEIHFATPKDFRIDFDNEIYTLIKKFKYRSVHAMFKDENREPLEYPNNKYQSEQEITDTILEKADCHTILFHPNIVKNLNEMNRRYSNKLAFENMDHRKDFGNTVEDMKTVFEKAPKAKWVCDVTHLYLIDNSLSNSKNYHNDLGDRLCHYHISSYGKTHDCFTRVGLRQILDGVLDRSAPMVHEGFAIGHGLMEEELEFVRNYLDKRKFS